jgi:hypothetical protein
MDEFESDELGSRGITHPDVRIPRRVRTNGIKMESLLNGERLTYWRVYRNDWVNRTALLGWRAHSRKVAF